MKKRDRVLQAAKSHLIAALGDRIKSVVLFGSRAWGRPKRWSDYDFVVVVRGENSWQLRHSIWDVMTDIDLKFDVVTQSLVVSEDELLHSHQRYEPVFVKALSQGIYA